MKPAKRRAIRDAARRSVQLPQRKRPASYHPRVCQHCGRQVFFPAAHWDFCSALWLHRALSTKPNPLTTPRRATPSRVIPAGLAREAMSVGRR